MKYENVVLLSGGIDSALAWCIASSKGPTVGLFFKYGQAHMDMERKSMIKFSQKMGIDVIEKSLDNLNKSDEVVFIGRNLLFIAAGIPVATSVGASGIWMGCNWTDMERFPDCRHEFIKSVDVCASAYGVNVFAPLIGMTKQQVKKELMKFGHNIDDFWSCYSPLNGKPCGSCLACEVRK